MAPNSLPASRDQVLKDVAGATLAHRVGSHAHHDPGPVAGVVGTRGARRDRTAPIDQGSCSTWPTRITLGLLTVARLAS